MRNPMKTKATTEATVPPLQAALSFAGQAAAVRAEAEQLTTEAATTRTEAEAHAQAVRAEVQRMIAEAEQQTRTSIKEASALERLAQDLAAVAQYLTHADELQAQVDASEQRAADLVDEADGLGDQVEDLERRLAVLGVQREDTTAALTTAREAGDAEEVTALRGRLAGIDEVVTVLDGRAQAARTAINAIGEMPGAGTLAAAYGQAKNARAQLRKTLNILDPERFEAVQDRLLDLLGDSVAAYTAPQPQPAQRSQPVALPPRVPGQPMSMAVVGGQVVASAIRPS